MNKIYKVIWSKAKHTYVVASEIAKGHTKGETTGKGLKRLAAALLVAAALLSPNFAWAADTTKVEPAPDGSATAVEVYTKEEANNAFATIENVSTLGHTVNTLSSELDTLSTLVNTLQSSTAKVDADGKVAKAVAADSAESATKAEQDGAGNVIISTYATKTEVSQKADASTVTDEASAREAGDKTLNDRITAVKEHVLKETGDNYVSKADAAVQDAGVVKADKKIGENVTALGKGLYDETAARIGADAAQDKVIQAVNNNLVQSVTTINKNVADGFTALNQAGANEAAAREAKDNELNERITNEANGIHDEIKAGDEKLDTRITNVKEYLEKQTSDKYVSKADAAVQDGAIVKAANTIGENVTNLDAALAKETAARLGADKAQDKVIQQVNQNMVDGFNTINKNMADGFKALNQADANELAGRMAADTKLVEAVNSGVSLSNDNVLQKNTTAIDAQGNVTTSKTDANEMILNKGKDNQITLNEKGIKVGLNSGVMDKDGFYAGGDTYSEAKAALKSDGQIKGANGKFTVGASGNTTVTSLDAGTGTIQTKGDLYAKDATFSGDITAKDATLSGDLSAKDGTFSGDLSAKDGTFSGDVSAKDVTATGTLQGAEVTDGTATLKQGKLTGVKDIETEALHVNGDANVTGKLTTKDLEVTGEFNANTLKSRLDENNYTEIHGGNVTSKNLKVDKGVTRTSESSFDENGREEYVTDNDSRATVKVGANEISQTLDDKGDNPEKTASRVLSQNTNNKYEITDSVVEGNQSNVENRTADTTDSQISFKDDSGKVLNKSYITQNLKKVLMGVEEGDNKTTIEQDANNIINTAKNGTIKNDAKDLVNTATGNMTNTVGGKLLNDVTGDMENKVGGNLTTTVGGSQTTTVTGDSSLTAENINNTATNKITNKALDVETEAKSSIMNKVSNDYGSNTSTQLSYETKEEMSANGKTASYLRGAAEEKSQLTDGDKKTTIDTVAGQTNTNITEGKNISNSLQKADQAASSVTDGTNTTVVNQDAKSLASSITDGTKANNTISTVDKSEQLIKASDTQYSATSKTATKMEDALVSGSSIIDVIKNLDDAANPLISSAVTDGTNNTGVTQTAKDITNIAKNGTIANEAKDITNKATENMTNTVGKDLTTTVGGEMKTTVTGKVTEDYKSDLDTKVGGNETHYVKGNQTNTVSGDRTVNVKGTETENFNALVTSIKTDQKTSVGGNQTNIVGGDQQNTVSGSKTETVKGSVTEKYGSQVTTVDGDQSTHVGGNQSNVVAGNQTNTISGSKTESVKGAVTETYGSQTTKVNGDQSTTVTGKQTNSITGDQVNTIGGNQTTTVTGDSSLSAQNITNTASETLSNSAKNITNTAAEIENMASKSIKDKVGDNVSRTMTTSQIKESVVDGTNSNTSTKTGSKDMNIVTDGTSTSTLSQLAGSVNTSLKEVDSSGNSVKSLNNVQTVSEDTTKITDTATGDFSSRSQKANGFTSQVKNNSGGSNTVTDTATTSEQKLVSGNIIDILKDAENGYVNTTVSNSDGSSSTGVKQTYTDITNTAKQGTITNEAKNLVNKAEEKLSNSAAEIENTATTSIKDTVGKSTVTTTTDGTTFENTDHNGAIGDGSITKTTISGNTLETGKATMDYAEVMKDLRVGGTTITKDLHVTNNATIDGTLGVTGAANFQDKVTVAKDLSVGGNATVAGDVTADSYKVGDKTYIDKDGINANNQVIRNVGQGNISEGSTDAVSGGQLYETNTRVSGLETRMGTVETRVDKLDNKIDKVGANAAAMANLHPLEFDEDSKWNVAAAVGSSGSETASAVGVFYRPNENVMVNASAAMGTGENMFGGGVSLRLGHGGNKAKEAQMKAAAAENKELRAKVDDLTARMDALLSVLNPNMSKDFPDVPENHWAYEAVSRLAGNGIVEGYEDGKYHGERQMTRYEMAEIIYNALSKGAKAEKKLVEEFRPELQAMSAQKKA